jgi:DNA end-binding protein Ku
MIVRRVADMKSIWNGSISFGLITIPVKMYSASDERRLEFDMLDREDNARIRYKRVNEDTGEEVEWGNIVKGYKLNDHYVILEKEDFDQANMKKTRIIEIDEFIDARDVEEVLYKKPYFLEPQKESGKAYNLLRDALKKTGKVGVATFVMRQKENLCLIGVYRNAIVLHVIRFADEIRDPTELNLPETKVSKKEVDMALSLIEQYTKKFDFTKYKDVYNDQLLKIIKAKTSGKKTRVQEVKSPPTGAKDLMKQLQASLAQKKNGKGKNGRKKNRKKSKTGA